MASKQELRCWIMPERTIGWEEGEGGGGGGERMGDGGGGQNSLQQCQ